MTTNTLLYSFAGLGALAIPFLWKILAALVVFLAGRFFLKKLVALLEKSSGLQKLEGTVRSFTISSVKMGLYILLVITIIGILGVPMASVITVLASAGVAVGLALQGALSNLAGGIMLLIFKPFKVGDYVDTAGVSGTVKEVTLFYTVLMTPDNRRITVPNGSLMNANVVDYSAEDLRRVDLTFTCGRTEAPARVREVILEALRANEQILEQPDAPFARLSGCTNEALEFTVRVWCHGSDYWDVYYDLTQHVTEALIGAGVKAPAVRYMKEESV